MGVIISNKNCIAYDGTSTSFNNLRRYVLYSIGGSFPSHSDIDSDLTLDENKWYFERKSNQPKVYSRKTHEGLADFFSLSDCEGEISVDKCGRIAKELTNLLPMLKNLTVNDNIVIAKERVNSQFDIHHYNKLLVTFIKGCETAYQTNDSLTLR